MRKASTELFLARKISDGSGANRSLLGVASAAVAVSTAVMIVTLAVIGGFRRGVTDKLTGFLAHIRVEQLQSANVAEQSPIVRDEAFEQEIASITHVASITPYASKQGLVKSSTAMEGISLDGVTTGYDSLFYKQYLVEGRLPRVGGAERRKEILVSRSLANLLQVGVGDRVELIFLGSDRLSVRRDRMAVSGIYSSGMEEFDRVVALTDMRNVQRLNLWNADQISGYRIMATSLDQAPEVAGEVRVAALYAGGNDAENLWRTSEVHTSYPYIFDWLATHNVNATVIVVIMLAVALLNMISALLITLFERTRTIGILKALGMRDRPIGNIFLLRSGVVIGRGMLWGNIAGLAVVAIQGFTGLIKLDAEAYMLSSVPVAFGWGWWPVLNVAVPVVLLLLLSLPVRIISRIEPGQTLKYQ